MYIGVTDSSNLYMHVCIHIYHRHSTRQCIRWLKDACWIKFTVRTSHHPRLPVSPVVPSVFVMGMKFEVPLKRLT